MACWQNPNLERDIYRIPLVGVNFTYITQFPNGLFGIPPRSVFIHPSNTELAIIGWRSPFTGSVNVVARGLRQPLRAESAFLCNAQAIPSRKKSYTRGIFWS